MVTPANPRMLSLVPALWHLMATTISSMSAEVPSSVPSMTMAMASLLLLGCNSPTERSIL
ncbi:MAG: hypothetical protein ACYTFW_17375 [Planctomycetota bacterium]